MNEIVSTSRNTPCTKRDCYYCAEMERQTQEHKEWYMPLTVEFAKKDRSTHVMFNESNWTGCDMLNMIIIIQKPCDTIARNFPNRTLASVQQKVYKWRKILGKKSYSRLSVPF